MSGQVLQEQRSTDDDHHVTIRAGTDFAIDQGKSCREFGDDSGEISNGRPRFADYAPVFLDGRSRNHSFVNRPPCVAAFAGLSTILGLEHDEGMRPAGFSDMQLFGLAMAASLNADIET
ncbi:hypothetical protein GCM10025787_07790 [Saccharopolyspora rosea]